MKKKNNKRIIDITMNGDDRISQLPEFILHHIMSFLYSPEELVRMSILSKKWFYITSCFPILDFNFANFTQALRPSIIPSDKHKDLFFKYVEYTTSRFCHQNVTSAHTFTLVAELQTPTQVDVIDRCLQLILKQHVQKLAIYLVETDPSSKSIPKYRLPNNILLSASSLTSLMLLRCGLPSSLMVDAVKFKSLKVLNLNRVPIDDEVITRLTTSCPLLEEFRMDSCYGFKKICIYWHQNLQNVQIFYTHEVESIDIDAPNLSYLRVSNISKVAPCMNLVSSKKLSKLYYSGNFSPSFADFSSNFPFLEDFSLKLPDECKRLKLTSPSLRKFVLHSKCELEELDINAPNLLLFVYSDIPLMLYSSVRDPAQSNACMECNPRYEVDIPWFQKLRRFLDKKNAFRVLKLCIRASFIDVEELKVIQSPSPYELEHVDLELYTLKEISMAVYLAVVDAVVWCFRPRSLTLRSKFYYINSEERIQVVKFTYEKLLQQENEDQTSIYMVVSSSSKDKKRFNDLNSLLTESPYGINKITFIKEEETVVQEA